MLVFKSGASELWIELQTVSRVARTGREHTGEYWKEMYDETKVLVKIPVEETEKKFFFLFFCF